MVGVFNPGQTRGELFYIAEPSVPSWTVIAVGTAGQTAVQNLESFYYGKILFEKEKGMDFSKVVYGKGSDLGYRP